MDTLGCPHSIVDRAPLFAKIRKGAMEIIGVKVRDLSLAGCMLDWHAWALSEGQRVLVSLPGLANLPAKVLWIEEDRVGILFDELLNIAVFDHLLRRFRMR